MYNIKKGENCKTYCRFAKFCNLTGWNGYDPNECGMAFKIDDMLMDAADLTEEQRKNSKDYYPEEEEDE